MAARRVAIAGNEEWGFGAQAHRRGKVSARRLAAGRLLSFHTWTLFLLASRRFDHARLLASRRFALYSILLLCEIDFSISDNLFLLRI
jgi:hypothetical protein